jgi:hypothetical protein
MKTVELKIAHLLIILLALGLSPSFAWAQDNTLDSIIQDYTPPREWVAPESKNYQNEWKTKISSKLNDPKWVQTHCASKQHGRTSEETKASLGGIHHDRVTLKNICHSELLDPDLKKRILSSFQDQYQEDLLHAYLEKSPDGSVEIHYLTPRFDCLDRGTGANEKIKNKLHLDGGAGVSTGLAPKKTSTGCEVNQPLGEKSSLFVFVKAWKEQTTVPGKYVQEASYLAKPQLDAWISEKEDESQTKTRLVLDGLERKIKQKKSEIELELQEKPLFEIPGTSADDDNYAYIIDRTGSYQGSFDKVIDELIETVKNYPEDKHFSIAFFGTKRGQSSNTQSDNLIENGRLILASAQNKQKIISSLLAKKEEAKSIATAATYDKNNVIMNEYAADVMNQIAADHAGKRIHYKYFGDGRININQTSEKNLESKIEKEKQIQFMKTASQQGSFSFIPLADQYSQEFKEAAEKHGKFVLPKTNRNPASEYFSKRKTLLDEIKKIDGDWQKVQTIKLAYDPKSSLFDTYQKYSQAILALKKAETPAIRDQFNKQKSSLETQLKLVNISHQDLPFLIEKYGSSETLDLPLLKTSQSFGLHYHLSTDLSHGINYDILKKEKRCK